MLDSKHTGEVTFQDFCRYITMLPDAQVWIQDSAGPCIWALSKSCSGLLLPWSWIHNPAGAMSCRRMQAVSALCALLWLIRLPGTVVGYGRDQVIGYNACVWVQVRHGNVM